MECHIPRSTSAETAEMLTELTASRVDGALSSASPPCEHALGLLLKHESAVVPVTNQSGAADGDKAPVEASKACGSSETAEMLSTAAQKAGVFLVGGSFPERDGDKLYNSCFVFNKDGDMIARHRKIHLFDIDIPGKITFKESDSLSPGDAPTVVDLSEHGGPPVRMGIGICYDIRFSELATIYRQLGSAPVSERFQ